MAALFAFLTAGTIGYIITGAGSTLAAGTGGVLSKYTWFRIQYKWDKKRIYNLLEKSIEELDYTSFCFAFIQLQEFDRSNKRDKCIKFKKKFRFNKEILDNKDLFLIKFNPDLLVSEIHKLYDDKKESDEEYISDKEVELEERELAIEGKEYMLENLDEIHLMIKDERENLEEMKRNINMI